MAMKRLRGSINKQDSLLIMPNSNFMQGELVADTSDLLILEELSDSISAIEPRKNTESDFLDSQIDPLNNEDQFSLFVKKCMENYSALKLKHEMLINKHKLLQTGIKKLQKGFTNSKTELETIKTQFRISLYKLIESICSKIFCFPSLKFPLEARSMVLDQILRNVKFQVQRNEGKVYNGQQILNKSEESQDLFAMVDRGRMELVAKELSAPPSYEKEDEHNKENIMERLSKDKHYN